MDLGEVVFLVDRGVGWQLRPAHRHRQQQFLHHQRHKDDAGGDEDDEAVIEERLAESRICGTESTIASETAPRKPASPLTK
ncbi:hypothetical protein [Streptomyces sp. NPDC003015]